MPNIVHLTSAHPRHDIRIFKKQCVSLVKAGYRTHLVVADGEGDEERDGVFIHDVGKFYGRLNRMCVATRAVLVKALEIDADVYHLHDPELIPIGLKLKKRAGKKVVFDAHEDVPKQILGKPYLNGPAKKAISKAFALYEAAVCRRFDAVVAATPYIREKYARLGVQCIDVNNFPLSGELSEGTVDWAVKQSHVAYVGGITEVRGAFEMVQAMAHVESGARLQLIGKFDGAQLERRVHTEIGWCNVDALGFLGRGQVARVLRRSVAGLVTFHPAPNHLDAQPNKMFEYMSAGVPVIASDFPLWREIIEGNQCGLCVDPLDPEAIAQAIDYLVTHPAEAEQMGRNGQKAVEQKYNWALEEKKLLKLYTELL